MPTLTTLVSFNGTDGKVPGAGVIADAAGNLLGTTAAGGANGDGEVFEIAKSSGGYASTPTILTSFDDFGQGTYAEAGLITDAAGDLFGEDAPGGAYFAGEVFEIATAGGSYAGTPTPLISFNGTDGRYPYGGLIADADGDLFGTTTAGGVNNDGTVFELVNNGSGSYTLATLFSFSGVTYPSGIAADAAGDLIVTTGMGGANNDGAVLEFAKTSGGFASTPITLVSFSGANGAEPGAGVIVDGAGDLFGITSEGGATGDGTVFEIPKTTSGYGTLETLVTFDLTNGQFPSGSLIADGAGDLFGTTFSGGLNNDGTVFEIVKTGGSYASTPTTLVNFNGTNGSGSQATLIADGAGNLFGTTDEGGANGDGTVFEITGSGFVTSALSPTITGTVANQVVSDETITFNSAADFEQGFTSHSNPNGVWTYGYSTGFTSPVTLYDQTVQNGVNGPNAQYWLSSLVDIGTSPAAEFNDGPAYDDGNIDFLSHQFILVSEIGSLYSDLIFTAPTAGTYRLATSFRGDQYGIGTLVGVVKNGNVLFDSSVTAEGQIVPFNTLVSLAAGDTVVYSVGPGGGLQNTGLSAVVTSEATISPFSHVRISDPNLDQMETVTVTLSAAANGNLSNLGGGSYNPTTGVYSYTGTAAAVTKALDSLLFTPTANQVAPGQTVTTTFTIYDIDTAGASATDSTTTVIATDVAVPPNISGTAAGQKVTDPQILAPFAGVTIADANIGQTETVTVTLSNAANGTLLNLGGGSYDVSSGVYTDIGTAAAVTAALDNLVFEPTEDQVAAGQTVTTRFTITDTDTAGESATDSITTVTATSAGPIIADLARDWSNTSNPNTSNPNGTWQYRQGTAAISNLVPSWQGLGPAWAPSNTAGDYLPAMFQATTNEVPDNWQAGDVIMHTVDGANGNPSLGVGNYLFTSAVSGTFDIVGDIWDASQYYGTSRPQDWDLLVNGVSVASGSLNGLVNQADPTTFDITNVAFIPGTAVELDIYEAGSLGFFVGANLTIGGDGFRVGNTINLPTGNNTVTVNDATLSGGPVIIKAGTSGNNSISAAGDTTASKGGRLAYYAGTGTDSFTGGFENDTVRVSAAAVGGDTLTGGSGTNTLVLTSAGSVNLGGVSKFGTINLAAGNSTVTVTDTTLSGGSVTLHDGASGNNTVSAAGDTSASKGKTLIYYPGPGTDSFTGGFENDVVYVSAAAVGGDTLTGGSGTNTLVLTSAGSVNLGGVSKFGTINLAAGNSTVSVTDTTLSGGPVALHDGASGNNSISAAGDTTASKGERLAYYAGTGTDSFTGGFENDTARVSAAAVGGDTLTGGSGTNTLVLTSAGSVNLGGVSKFGTINLAAGNSTVTVTDTTLSGGSVTLHDGASGNNTVSAAGDTSASKGKTLIYYPGPGTDSFTGGFENDVVYVSAAAVGGDTLTGGSGTNTLVLASAGSVNLGGVSKFGTINLAAGNSTVTVTDTTLSGGPVALHDGASGNNSISAAGDTTASEGERFAYYAGTGTDSFTGGFENDTVRVSAAAVGGDTLTGGSGTNALVLTNAGIINLGGVSKFGTINLAAGNSTVTVTDTTLSGGTVALHDGASGNNAVSAAGDTIASTGKTLIYYEGSGTDNFTGGFENDIIYAGTGMGTYTAGSGSDSFVFIKSSLPSQTLDNFQVGSDDILVYGTHSTDGFDLGSTDNGLNPSIPTAIDPSIFIASASGAFTSSTQRFAYDTSNGQLFYSATGSNSSESLVATLTGAPAFTSSNMLFEH